LGPVTSRTSRTSGPRSWTTCPPEAAEVTLSVTESKFRGKAEVTESTVEVILVGAATTEVARAARAVMKAAFILRVV
jgi:hypothetical protein